MASRSRWLVGSSSSRRLVPRATSTARPARERSPGDRSASARPACSAPRSNLASKERACSTLRSVRSRTASSTVPDPASRSWPRWPTTTPAPSRAQPAGQQPEQGRLAGAVGAGEGEPVAPAQLQVDRAEPEAAALRDRPDEAGRHRPAAVAGAQRQAQVPALPGLLRVAEAFDAALDRLGLGGAGGGALLAPAGEG